MDDRLTGVIDCSSRCMIPAGVTLVRVPKPRHAWSDVIVCPICDSAFLKLPQGTEAPSESPSTKEASDA